MQETTRDLQLYSIILSILQERTNGLFFIFTDHQAIRNHFIIYMNIQKRNP